MGRNGREAGECDKSQQGDKLAHRIFLVGGSRVDEYQGLNNNTMTA
jgi:hypothetical protein